jgi:hypothetical protein
MELYERAEPGDGDRREENARLIAIAFADMENCAMQPTKHSRSPKTMPPIMLTSDSLTQALRGKQVSHASIEGKQRLSIRFADGVTLDVEASSNELVAVVKRPEGSTPKGTSAQPTKRQLEYLAFIAKYIDRFGRSPAESDIERHFLVSPPSVNQMMKTLERRGFITRQRGVPRSARICIDLS